jgi:hypothetical protein
MQGHREKRGWTIPEAVYPAFLATCDDREGRGETSGMGKLSSATIETTQVQIDDFFWPTPIQMLPLGGSICGRLT